MAPAACKGLPLGPLAADSARALVEQTNLPADAADARVPHLLARALASVSAHTLPSSQQHYVSRASNLLTSLLGSVGGPPDPATASPSLEALAATSQAALLRRLARARVAPEQRRQSAPAPTNYLAGVAQAVAALQTASGAAPSGAAPSGAAPSSLPTPPTARAGADVQRALQDDHDVAAQLALDPAGAERCTLRLLPLGPSRTQAAIAAKLPRVAAVLRSLCHHLQSAEVDVRARAALLSSERAALLAASLPAQPLPHPQLALTDVLFSGRAVVAARQQARAAAPAPVPAGRQVVNDGVLAQHKQLKKSWMKRRQHEMAERLEALKGQDYEEYLRLLRQRRGGASAKTDACLRQLAGRLRAAGAGRALEATAAGGGSPSLSGSPQAGSGASGSCSPGVGVAALEQSHESWNQLANAFQAGDVPEQPALLRGGALRDYQVKGLRWLVGLHRQGLNGILADEMGLGKTVQVIALACHLAGGGEGPAPASRPMLIAAPASVLPNWEAELRRWAPGLKVVSYKGSAEAREEVWTHALRKGRGAGGASGVQVVLTTYEMLMGKHDKPRLARVSWGYIVVDEGHRLKNSGCRLNAELRGYGAAHRLLLTGTPLQNRLEELWSLLNFLQPSLFNSSDDFQEWFGSAGAGGRGAAGAAAAGGYDSSDDEGAAAAEAAILSQEEALLVTNRLHQVLRPFMLRRLKEGVAGELPQKSEHLLSVPPSPYQQALFGLMERDVEGGVRGVNNAVMELRTICNHPLISRLHPEGAELQLPPHSLPPEVRLCSKLELLDRLLVKLRAGGHKVLLFSTMTRALDVIEDHLGWRGWPCLRLDGNTGTADRGRLVQRFNDPAGAEFVFLLSIRAGGVGLNLQAADTVIMYDTDWNPQMDLQAQARAHRLGQQHEVKVLRLVTAGSIEERVVGVASGKAQLADRSITGGFFDGKTSASERQRYLLEAIRSSAAAPAAKDGTAGGGAGGADDALSDAALNALLARRPGEAEALEAQDARVRAGELAAWQAATGAAPAAFSRLASAEEVAPLVGLAQELLAPKKDDDEGLELGRGKRQRGTAAYRDLPEAEFRRLVNEGAGDGQQAVPLLAAASPAAASAPDARQVPPAPAAAAAPAKRRKAAAAAEPAVPALPSSPAPAFAPGSDANAAPAPAAAVQPSSPEQALAPALAGEAPPVQPKRGRGRPRKERPAPGSEDGASAVPALPSSPVQELAAADAPPKRGRGRPRKEDSLTGVARGAYLRTKRRLSGDADDENGGQQQQQQHEQQQQQQQQVEAAAAASPPPVKRLRRPLEPRQPEQELLGAPAWPISSPKPALPKQPEQAGGGADWWPHAHIPRPPKRLYGVALASYLRKQEALAAAAEGGAAPAVAEPAPARQAQPQGEGAVQRAPVAPAQPEQPPAFAWPHAHIPRPAKQLYGVALASYLRKQEALLEAEAAGATAPSAKRARHK